MQNRNMPVMFTGSRKLMVFIGLPFALLLVTFLVIPHRMDRDYINRRTASFSRTITYFGVFTVQRRPLKSPLLLSKSLLTAPDLTIHTGTTIRQLWQHGYEATRTANPRGRELVDKYFKLFDFLNQARYEMTTEQRAEILERRVAIWNSPGLETMSMQEVSALTSETDAFKAK